MSIAKFRGEIRIVPSKIFGLDIQKYLEILYGFSFPPKTLAQYFPTSCSIILLQRGEEKEALKYSTIYWHRVINGSRRIADKSLIERVTRHLRPYYLPGYDETILHWPLWDLLCNPLSTKKELIDTVQSTIKYLDGNYLSMGGNGYPRYKKEYWNPGKRLEVNGPHLLAQKLALYRLSHLTKIDSRLLWSPLDIWLQLLRMLTFEPLSKFFNPIIKGFYVFIHACENKARGTKDLDLQITSDIAFQRVFDMTLEKAARQKPILSSFEAYKGCNLQLIENTKAVLNVPLNTTTQISMDMEILYWADRYHEDWLYQGHDKQTLFNKGKPLHQEVFQHLLYGNKKHVI